MAGEVSPASAWFMAELLAMDPGTKNAGIYARQAGYHGTGNDNEALGRYAAGQYDYSIRDAEDRRGAGWRTRAAGYDWTFPEAQAGDYRRMAKYGARLRAAYDARDPRLAGWREALGQVDADAAPEGLDFRRWYTRTPDNSHQWHWHFSEDREQVESYDNKRALLSVLSGQTLTQWQEEQNDMQLSDRVPAAFTPDNMTRTVEQIYSDVWRGVQIRLVDFIAEQRAANATNELRDRAAIAALEALRASGGVDIAPAVTAVRELQAEARERFTALETALARAEARAEAAEVERDTLAARLAAALDPGE